MMRTNGSCHMPLVIIPHIIPDEEKLFCLLAPSILKHPPPPKIMWMYISAYDTAKCLFDKTNFRNKYNVEQQYSHLIKFLWARIILFHRHEKHTHTPITQRDRHWRKTKFYCEIDYGKKIFWLRSFTSAAKSKASARNSFNCFDMNDYCIIYSNCQRND